MFPGKSSAVRENSRPDTVKSSANFPLTCQFQSKDAVVQKDYAIGVT